MELTVRQRLVLLSLLPGEGNLLTMKLIRQTRDDLGFSAEELDEYKLEFDGGNVKWDGLTHTKTYNMSERILDVVRGELAKLDAAGKINDDLFEVAELVGYEGTEADAHA